jgi:hypothetical protein
MSETTRLQLRRDEWLEFVREQERREFRTGLMLVGIAILCAGAIAGTLVFLVG